MKTAILYEVDRYKRTHKKSELPEKTIRKIPKIERVFPFTINGDLKAYPNCETLLSIKEDVDNGLPVYRIYD